MWGEADSSPVVSHSLFLVARGAKTTGDGSEEEMFHLSVLSFYFTVTQRLAGPRLGFAILYSIVGPLPCCLLSKLYGMVILARFL